MTLRARGYLSIASARHLLTAGFALAAPGAFQSQSFAPILDAAPLWLWGLVFIGAGISCGLGALVRSAGIARLGLMWSATSTAMVAVGLLLAYFTGDLTSPTGPIIWAAVAFKDFTVCADPLRSPFEEWAEEWAEDEPDRGDETHHDGGL